MDLVATLFSAGWASGVNAWATVALLNLLGRAGIGDVPGALEGDVVLVVALAMYAVEFVADKVPYVDNLWDAGQTVFRPAIGGAIGASFGNADELAGLEEALATGGTGATALASHAVKASLRLGINTSPEPFTNIFASLAEDGLAALVVILALEQPWAAAIVAATLLALGIGLVIFLWTRIRNVAAYVRRRYRRGPPGGAVSPPA